MGALRPPARPRNVYRERGAVDTIRTFLIAPEADASLLSGSPPMTTVMPRLSDGAGWPSGDQGGR